MTAAAAAASLAVSAGATTPLGSGPTRWLALGGLQAVAVAGTAWYLWRRRDEAAPAGPKLGTAAPLLLGRTLPAEAESRPGDTKDATAGRVRFDARLERALDGAGEEADVLATMRRAIEQVTPNTATELLLVSPRSGIVVQALECGPDAEGPGCPVGDPRECEAMRTGQTRVFDASTELDACPHLRDRSTAACSATCVPLRVLGDSIGVLHQTGPLGVVTPEDTVARLESLASKAGTRLSLLRLAGGARSTSIDTATGVLDRASIEEQIKDLARNLTPFSLAQCDMDHFHDYNRTFGSDTGDQALRFVARTLTEILRPGDLIGRFGDDELLIALPGASSGEAQRALERAREHLALSLSGSRLPPFTCSFGVVESAFGQSLDELLVAADVAVSLAKDLGRNRVVVTGELVYDPLGEED